MESRRPAPPWRRESAALIDGPAISPNTWRRSSWVDGRSFGVRQLATAFVGRSLLRPRTERPATSTITVHVNMDVDRVRGRLLRLFENPGLATCEKSDDSRLGIGHL